MKNLRNEKGITLVALVVTIIVLLILAGVSLSLVAGGNGIINKAATAQDKTIAGSAKEQAELKLAELVADYYEEKYVYQNLTSTITNKKDYIVSKVTASGVNIGDYTMKVEASGTITVTDRATTPKTVASGTVDDEGKVTWSTTTTP